MSNIWDKLERARPCPFCGERPTIAIMVWPRGTKDVVWTMQCTHCGASGPNLPTQEGAVDAWESGKWEHDTTWDSLAADARQPA